jgi:carbon monoxide dehydrogenase subunit G
MQMNDSQRIPASKDRVWAALNDPEVLKQCIPGCQSLEMSTPNEMTATVVFKVGPVKATFGGKVTLSDLDPPNSYRISGEGSGGVAGFAKGGATVKLSSESPDVTVLHYDVEAQIRGQARAARQPPDRYHREKTCRRILCLVRRGGCSKYRRCAAVILALVRAWLDCRRFSRRIGAIMS